MTDSLLLRRLLPAALLVALVAGRAAAQETTQNPHGTLATACSACHTAEGWAVPRVPKGFDHAPRRFPLGGAHAVTSCRACHRALDFTGTPTACATCHKDVHNGELGADCGRCHTDRGFVDRAMMIRQHQTTRFTLAGSHAAVDCEECHTFKPQGSMQFVNTPTDCDACHEQRFLATRNPDHQSGGFPRNCTQCHSTTLWTPARFNHDAGGFALTGAHRAVQCDQCHAGNRFAGAPSDCSGCHADEYQATTSPAHAAAAFPTTCTQCHTTTAWAPASFDHGATAFALTGAHRAVACNECHVGGRFAGTPVDCAGCHLDDYQATTDPGHVASNFPQTCASCHGTSTWDGATFNHNASRFPLTGAHVPTPCASCHVNNVFAGTPATCYACHGTDYANSRDPAHQAASLPTDCTACHTTTAWPGARYTAHDATWFPIYSGAHAGRWSGSCATCHTSPTSYATFTCLTCHLKPAMDNKHSGRSGYSYDSQACYRCHPRGDH